MKRGQGYKIGRDRDSFFDICQQVGPLRNERDKNKQKISYYFSNYIITDIVC